MIETEDEQDCSLLELKVELEKGMGEMKDEFANVDLDELDEFMDIERGGHILQRLPYE